MRSPPSAGRSRRRVDRLRRTRAFTVAKAARPDILADIRGGLDDALANGLTRRQFLKEMEPRLRKLGWWGRQVIVSPSGEAEMVQLGSPRRLKTIFDVNMRATFGAESWRRQSANRESRPYLMYSARQDRRTRPAHRAMDGQVFHVDDPIWNTHYPPNGWNCRCQVRALTEGQVEARGIQVRDSAGHLREVEQHVGKNKRTGEILTRPGTEYRWRGADGREHALTPDAGWSYNPGKAPFGPAGSIPPGRLLDPAGGQKTWSDLGLPETLPLTPAGQRLPRARPQDGETIAAAQKRQIYEIIDANDGRRIGYPRADGGVDTAFLRLQTPVDLDDVMLTDGFVDHLIDDHTDQREQFAKFVIPTLRDPGEVWLQAKTDRRTGAVVYRRHFVASPGGELNTIVIVQEDLYGQLSWTMFSPRNLNRFRQGHLLYRRPESG